MSPKAVLVLSSLVLSVLYSSHSCNHEARTIISSSLFSSKYFYYYIVKVVGQSTGVAINGEKATRWVGGREKIQYASASLRTCLKSKAEMWLASVMRGFTRAGR